MLEDLLQRRSYNAAVDFVDANVARGLGQKVAFIDPARSLTYGELQARTHQFAAALKALGLRQEDRILLLLPDTVDYPVAFWGAVRAGIIAIPLNTLLSPDIYAYIMADSRATAMVAATPLARNILRSSTGCRGCVPSCSRARVPTMPQLFPVLMSIISTSSLRASRRSLLPRRHSRTRWRSGCTPRARRVTRKASSMCTRRRCAARD